MANGFICLCGAKALRCSGNVFVHFPEGLPVLLCSGGCPEMNSVRRKADRAWQQAKASRTTVGAAFVAAGALGRTVKVPEAPIEPKAPKQPFWAKRFPHLYDVMMTA